MNAKKSVKLDSADLTPFCSVPRWALLMLILLSGCQSTPTTRPVYGADTREEMINGDPMFCRVGSATAALYNRTVFSHTASDDRWHYRKFRSLASQGWCESERFAEQNAQAHCTAFLITPDRIATAGHCVNAENDTAGNGLNCTDLLIVFDYFVGVDGRTPDSFADSSVYQCRAVLAGTVSAIGADWRVVELERSTGREPIPMYTDVSLPAGTPLAVVGHPLGLPMKLASGHVHATAGTGLASTFTAFIDTYERNSGSPLLAINGERLELVGLLTSGHPDAETTSDDNGCLRSIQCSESNSCSGEQATLSSVLLPFTDSKQSPSLAQPPRAAPCTWCRNPLRSHHWQCHLENEEYG